jgi:eukaryotic-like serine/threonine-protein kinase
MSLTSGTKLGAYTLVGPLGAGGMGVVYRARDERLGREVAVKLVPSELLNDEVASRRFHQEARTLSSLSHPNIATLFEFDSDQGVEFLVMELVSGVSLRQKLAAGALPLKELLALGSQIAQGLAAAHEANIVHRDLKPENIMVTPQGHLKILDFGLAKWIPASAEKNLGATASYVTGTGVVSGTLPYMAPEQLRGEATDVRVDVHAAGAVLYEMATGRPPFEQRGALLVEAILNREPPAPSAVNPRLPPALDGIVLKALDKDPGRRYQSAREMAVDLERLSAGVTRPLPSSTARALRRWQSVLLLMAVLGLLLAGVRLGTRPGASRGAGGTVRSLAVLPLTNLSGDPQQQYFADGMTDELTTEMSRIHALRVVSRTSAMQYKDAHKTVSQIARELNVDAIIEGSVMRSGDRVRITAQLIHGADDAHLWAESYDHDLRDVITMQRQVARDVARQIEVALSPEERTRFSTTRPIDAEAHEKYLLGRYHVAKATEKDLRRAIGYFNEAIAKDPNYAVAYAGLSDAYTAMRSVYLEPHEVMPKAKAAALKALQLDESLAEAHVSLGGVFMFYDFDWSSAERELQRAIVLNPNLAAAHDYYALYFAARKQPDRAIPEILRACQLDPLSPVLLSDAAWVYYLAGRYDDSAKESLRAIELDPNFGPSYTFLGLAYEKQGDLPKAISTLEKAIKLDDTPTSFEMLGGAYATAGQPEKARQIAAQLVERSKHHYVCPYEVATIFAGLNDSRSAFEWLRKAQEDRADCIPWVAADQKLESLRKDPRFQQIVRAVGLPQ